MTSRRLQKPGLRRVAATTVAAFSALSITLGASAAISAPANAATQTSTPYLLYANAWGTKVKAPTVGLSSGPSAFTQTGCSNLVPRSTSNDVTAVGTGSGSNLTIGAVTTSTRAWHGKIHKVSSTAARGTSNVAEVAVGDPSTLQLQIKNLRGVSTAWANKRGYHASSTLALGSTALVGSGAAALGPVTTLLNGSTSKLMAALVQNPVVIPGLAEISLGRNNRTVTDHGAYTRRTGLVIDVFQSPTQLTRAPGDTVVTVGSSQARMGAYEPGGVFGGTAWAVDAPLLDGQANVGRNIVKPLSCFGTNGNVYKTGLALLNLGNANEIGINVAEADVYGAHTSTGPKDWTASKITEADLGGGQLVIKAITTKVLAHRGKDGKLHRSVRRSIGSITANGTTYPAPKPGQSVAIPNVGTIEVPKAVYRNSSVRATGLRVILLPGTAASSTLDLANAYVVLKH